MKATKAMIKSWMKQNKGVSKFDVVSNIPQTETQTAVTVVDYMHDNVSMFRCTITWGRMHAPTGLEKLKDAAHTFFLAREKFEKAFEKAKRDGVVEENADMGDWMC